MSTQAPAHFRASPQISLKSTHRYFGDFKRLRVGEKEIHPRAVLTAHHLVPVPTKQRADRLVVCVQRFVCSTAMTDAT
jgi:hypothetical protein